MHNLILGKKKARKKERSHFACENRSCQDLKKDPSNFFEGGTTFIILKLNVHAVGYSEWNSTPEQYLQSLFKS